MLVVVDDRALEIMALREGRRDESGPEGFNRAEK